MIAESTPYKESDRSSAEIESDIRETRGRMDATLDQLGDRLTPRSLLNSALDWWEDPSNGNQGTVATRNAAKSLLRQVRRHPMPSLLIGGGIAWLISEASDHEDNSSGNSQREYSHTPGSETYDPTDHDHGDEEGLLDKAKEKLSDAAHHAGHAVEAVRHKASKAGGKLQGRVDHLAHQAYDQGKSLVGTIRHEASHGYEMGAQRFGKAVEDYPLAVGAAFAGLGALVALIIPHTRREDKWMGEQSDDLLESAREKGHELLEAGKQIGSRVIDAVKEDAQDQGLTGETAGDALTNLAEKSGKVLQKAREEVASAAKDEGLTPANEELA